MSLHLQTTATTEVENDTAWKVAALGAERCYAANQMDQFIHLYSAVPESWNEELDHYALTDMLIEKAEHSIECLKATGERIGRIRRVKALLETVEQFRADTEMNRTTEREWLARASKIQSAVLEAVTAIRQSVIS